MNQEIQKLLFTLSSSIWAVRNILINDYGISESKANVAKENALNRDELVSKTGEEDRDIRTAIEMLRHDKVILTLSKGKGYYIPPDDAQGRQEAYKWIESQNSRIESIKAAERGAQLFINHIKNTKRKVTGFPGQLSLFGAGL